MSGLRANPAALALLALLAGGLLGAAPASFAPPPQFGGDGNLNGKQTAQALEAFREAGPATPSYLEFQLRHLPRRGPEQRVGGRLWASRNENGAVYRIEIDAAAAAKTAFLLLNGRPAQVWRAGGTSGAEPTEVSLFEPLVAGWELTAFDLERPYLFWELDGPVAVSRVRGRPADVFFFKAPAPVAPGGIAAVRAFLDSEYHAPVDVDSIGGDGRTLRTFSLLDLKKVGGQWLPQEIDARDEATHNKTRFVLTGAALNLVLSPAVFRRDGLTAPLLPPRRVERW